MTTKNKERHLEIKREQEKEWLDGSALGHIGLTYTQETFLCTYKEGELVCVEKQNGEIKRWTTKPATRADSMKIHGVDLPVNAKGL